MTAPAAGGESAQTASGDDVGRFGYTQELQRSLSFWDLLVYGLIFMVPIAPFGIFGSVFQGSGGMVALAYVVGLVGMAFTALSYAEMSKAFPLAGSVYTYNGRGLHPAVGFLSGWLILLDYVLVPALLYLIAALAMHSFVGAIPVWAWVVLFIAVNTAVNYFGIEMTARVNRLMLVAELAVLAIFLLVAVVALAQGKGHFSFSAFYDKNTFSIGVVFTAVSVAVLSFLGFDGISTLAEENREEARQIGRSMVAALALAGTLFVLQTWFATMFVSDPQKLLTDGDPNGTAFYDAAEVAGGHWLSVLTAVATAIAWGFANALVAQAATSRLLFSMARDRQLPSFLAKVHPTYKIPTNATLLVALVSVGVGLWAVNRDDGATLLTTLVNFGALSAFIVLHVAVIVHFFVRRRTGDVVRHLIVPLCGIAVLGFVVYKANVAAQRLGFTWLAVGVVVLVIAYATGRKPVLSGIGTESDEVRV